MAKINLGGEDYVNAQETDFKVETDGLKVYKVIALEMKENGILEVIFDVAYGPNKGVGKELTEKFGKEEYPWLKYFGVGFNIGKEGGMKRLKGLITKIGEDPANKKVGAEILKANKEGEIDDELLVGTVVGIDTIWEKNDSGYYNLETNGFKPWRTVEEAKNAPVGVEKPKAEVTASDFDVDEDEEDDWA